MTATEENEDRKSSTKDADFSGPVKTVEDKWLLPAFLKAKGLGNSTSTRSIILSTTILRTSSTPTTMLPQMSVQSFPSSTPKSMSVCRSRTTMEVVVAAVTLGTAPSHRRMQVEGHDGICTRVRRYRVFTGSRRIKRPRVMLTRLPTMLGSNNCTLSGRSGVRSATMSECPLDPGGHRHGEGHLVQEQLSKGRTLVETDSSKGIVIISVTL